ncbi:hypothetical protein ACIDE9_04655 [Methylophilus sp. 'Pure River']|uniref:hypothetical protein n=1 Tax=Methylophilus sp. 'Pure River' TaxID=3377117 RepID=UPI00398F6CF8
MNENTKQKIGAGFLTLPVLRDLLLILFIAIVTWKLINAHIQVDFAKFSFSELLAMILALFSIWLSVAFYFKAGETSNQFYDNSYKFTKEMSEVLGRIEAGFGERLRHLDEGYSGVRDRLDRMPHYGASKDMEVKKEEAEVKKHEEEQKKLLENLATRAQLAEGEKKEIFARLAETNEELEQARMELRRLQHNDGISLEERELRRSLFRYISEKIRQAMPPNVDQKSSQASILRVFRSIRDDIHRDAIRDLERFDYLNENGDLTRDAIMRIRMEMKRI